MNLREHWAKRALRAKHHRGLAKMKTLSMLDYSDSLDGRETIHVKLTRKAPRKLDDDGNITGCKHARDGIADAFGINDGSDRFQWSYAQEKSKTYGLHVDIEISG